MTSLPSPISGESTSDVPKHNPPSKLKTYGFVIAIIMGIGGFAAGGAGVAGYFQVGALSNMAQIDAIIMMGVGWGGGAIFSIIAVKNRKAIHSSESLQGDLQMQYRVQDGPILLVQGDLLDQNVEAIVNAANPSLEGGGGIDGAIHSAAGSQLAEACRSYKKQKNIEKIKIGDAVATESFNIKERTKTIAYVIHTVGPDCRDSEQCKNRASLLAAAYVNSLEAAKIKSIKSIAFPAISTGIYGYPFEDAQKIAIKTVKDYLNENPGVFTEVRFVYYIKKDFQKAQTLWNENK
jgi:O-acetyl-ADP-ribose deacetylase